MMGFLTMHLENVSLTDRVHLELGAAVGVVDGLLHMQLVVQTALSVVHENQLLRDGRAYHDGSIVHIGHLSLWVATWQQKPC